MLTYMQKINHNENKQTNVLRAKRQGTWEERRGRRTTDLLGGEEGEEGPARVAVVRFTKHPARGEVDDPGSFRCFVENDGPGHNHTADARQVRGI